jgi:hypothetical protein
MANMIPISTVTVGSGGVSSIDFNSVPQTYTDLIVKVSARDTTANGEFYLRFNGSTTNYTDRWLYGTGSAVGATTNTKIDLFLASSGYTASTFGNTEIYIPNYTSNYYKPVIADSVQENNATSSYALLEGGLWSNTSPITSVNLIPAGGTFAQYSTATLYGIRKY